jgi:hypothetical protein
LEIDFLIRWPGDFQAWLQLSSLSRLYGKQVEDLVELAADHGAHSRPRERAWRKQLVELFHGLGTVTFVGKTEEVTRDLAYFA